MGRDSLTFSSAYSSADRENPSEYVKMEADLIARENSEMSSQKDCLRMKTILIYCRSHALLLEISKELKSKLNPDAEVLITTEKEIALRLLKSGDIDLLLHGPRASDLFAIYVKPDELSAASIGSSMIMINSHNPDLEQWMNQSKHSIHLTKAVTKLNGNTARAI